MNLMFHLSSNESQTMLNSSRRVSFWISKVPFFCSCRWVFNQVPRFCPSSMWSLGTSQWPSRSWNFFNKPNTLLHFLSHWSQTTLNSSRRIFFWVSKVPSFRSLRWLFNHIPSFFPSSMWLLGTLQWPSRSLNCFNIPNILFHFSSHWYQTTPTSSRRDILKISKVPFFRELRWLFNQLPSFFPSSMWFGGTLQWPSRFWNCFNNMNLLFHFSSHAAVTSLHLSFSPRNKFRSAADVPIFVPCKREEEARWKECGGRRHWWYAFTTVTRVKTTDEKLRACMFVQHAFLNLSRQIGTTGNKQCKSLHSPKQCRRAKLPSVELARRAMVDW